MESHSPSLTACLLAGGKSSRMGRDKAGVDFMGTPLWLHQLRTLRNTQADEILISGRKEALYGDCGLAIIEDEINNAGPLAGIASLLAAAKHPLVLMLAVDMPYITDAYLGSLRKQCSGTCGVVPEVAGFYEGGAAIFPKSAGAIVSQILKGDDHSIQLFVRECAARDLVRITSVAAAEIALFKSLNFPSDLPDAP